MSRFFEIAVLIFLVIVLIGAFWLYVYVIALGNPFPVIGGRVQGESTTNYNFQEPVIVPRITDFAISDKLNDSISNTSDISGEYILSIPSIDTSVSIPTANSLETFNQEGWLLLPSSYKYQKSYFARLFNAENRDRNEALIICHRNFYSARDSRSCFYLDRIEKDATINFDGNLYTVNTITVVPQSSNYIFEPSQNEDFLKIITNSGPNKEANKNSHYLVVIAEKSA